MSSQQESDSQSKQSAEGPKGMAEVADSLAQEEVKLLIYVSQSSRINNTIMKTRFAILL